MHEAVPDVHGLETFILTMLLQSILHDLQAGIYVPVAVRPRQRGRPRPGRVGPYLGAPPEPIAQQHKLLKTPAELMAVSGFASTCARRKPPRNLYDARQTVYEH